MRPLARSDCATFEVGWLLVPIRLACITPHVIQWRSSALWRAEAGRLKLLSGWCWLGAIVRNVLGLLWVSTKPQAGRRLNAPLGWYATVMLPLPTTGR